jgi:hypothetical protein
MIRITGIDNHDRPEFAIQIGAVVCMRLAILVQITGCTGGFGGCGLTFINLPLFDGERHRTSQPYGMRIFAPAQGAGRLGEERINEGTGAYRIQPLPH